MCFAAFVELLRRSHRLQDFTIEGKALEDVNDDNYSEAYRDKLIYAEGRARSYTTRSGNYDASIDGLIIRNMNLQNAGGECVRLRYFVTNCKIYNNTIRNCGVHDFDYESGGKNGEGIYIGTSNNQWVDNPTNEPDVCFKNHVYGNHITTEGNEGIEVKEGSINNVIEYNEVYMQMDPNSGGIGSRGDRSVIRYNHIEETVGSGVRLGGAAVDGVQYGVDNDVYGNRMRQTMYAGIKIESAPQGFLCGNDISVPLQVGSEDDYDVLAGNEANEFTVQEVTTGCPSSVPAATQPVPGDFPSPLPEPISTSSEEPSSTSSDDTSPTSSDESATPSPVPTPGEAEYVGCFADDKSDRVLSRAFDDLDDMTIGRCVSYCLEEGDAFAGLQYGLECWCGSTQNYDRHGTADCEMPCSGDDQTYCGDYAAFSLYKALDDESATNSTEPSQCYADMESDRIMTFGYTSKIGLTNQLCAEFCDESGYTYSGTQLSTECWCTDSDDYDKHGISTACNMQCSEPSDDSICGGSNAMTVSLTDAYETSEVEVAYSSDEYIGCFVDERDARVLELGYIDLDDMTPMLCTDFCREESARYAGLQYGSECWCGDTSTYSRYGTAVCEYGCTGNDTLTCGDYEAFSLYRT